MGLGLRSGDPLWPLSQATGQGMAERWLWLSSLSPLTCLLSSCLPGPRAW